MSGRLFPNGLSLFPNGLSRRTWQVWRRNWDVYQKTWQINFLPPILEPVFYLLAFGAGLGTLVGVVHYQGLSLSYVAFIAPGLISIAVMYNAFFENTYTSFVRMYYQKTYDALLATPLVLEEVIVGEIVWGATKALLAGGLMLGVVAFFRVLSWPHALLILPLALLGGAAFGASAMCFTAVVPRIEVFNLPIFLFITPMFLFSGTFFPLEALPRWAQGLALALPLTHLVTLVRAAALGRFETGQTAVGVAYLLVFTAVSFPLAIVLMRRRLVK
jgi:lipooligosaccharide transport system permease protein